MHPSDRDPKEGFVLSGNAPEREDAEEGFGYGRSPAAGGDWKRTLKPLVIAGGALLVLIVLALMFLTASPRSADREGLKNLEARLRAVEEKLARLEGPDAALARIERREKEIQALAERMTQQEAAWNRKFDQLAREAARPAARPAEAAPPPKAAETAVAKPGAAAAPPAARPRVHVVQKGETLHSISRRYKVPFDQLVKLNRLDPKAPIKVGQSLTLPPANGA
ncbi:MAG: LysM peptidoglycan-binding domain-containing protein [Desulfobacterales bacterium]